MTMPAWIERWLQQEDEEVLGASVEDGGGKSRVVTGEYHECPLPHLCVPGLQWRIRHDDLEWVCADAGELGHVSDATDP